MQVNESRRLQDQQERYAVLEFQVKRLMAKELHSKKRADAAAHGCKGKERCLRHAPRVTFGAQLIPSVCQECRQIDDGKISQNHCMSL